MGAATSHFLPGRGGGGEGEEVNHSLKKFSQVAPNFYEEKQGSYDKLT